MNSKCLRPQIFETDVNAPESAKKWKHWKKTFENYVSRIEGATARDKLDILFSLLDTFVLFSLLDTSVLFSLLDTSVLVSLILYVSYLHVSECNAYDETVARFENAYVEPVN